MGIDAHLQDELGNVLESVLDPNGLMSALLKTAPSNDLVCLPYIDPYGDTTFNRLQITALIAELRAAISRQCNEAIVAHARAVLRLAEKCLDEVHVYLKFVGD